MRTKTQTVIGINNLIPSTIDLQSVKSHFENLAISGEKEPELWNASLSKAREETITDQKSNHSQAREQMKRAAGFTSVELLALRDDIQARLISGRAQQQLVMIAARVVSAATQLGIARSGVIQLTTEIADLEAQVTAITEEIIGLQAPDATKIKRIEKLKKERHRLEKISNEFEKLTNSELAQRLRELNESGAYLGIPTVVGYAAHIEAINSEIETLDSGLYDERLDANELMQKLDELRERRAQIEPRLHSIRAKLSAQSDNERIAVTQMEGILLECHEEAAEVVSNYELDLEVLALTTKL